MKDVVKHLTSVATQQTPQFQVSFNELGFSVESIAKAEKKAALRWEEIVTVEAFKRDMFMYDEICLRFLCADGSSLELDEELGGWDNFLNALPKHLPGCQPHEQWFCKVAFPAFNANITRIFSRTSTQPA